MPGNSLDFAHLHVHTEYSLLDGFSRIKKLVKQGLIKRTETTVALVTGNGLKTQEAVMNAVGRPTRISPSLVHFQKTFGLGNHDR